MGEKRRGLNLGCGFQKVPSNEEIEWVNLDSDKECKPDCTRNVLRGIPFNDGWFDLVFCSHFLEHFGGEDFIFIMNEIHRVMKHDAELHIISPYYKHFGAWTDPNHKVFFNEHFFSHWWFPSFSSYSIGIRGFFYPILQEVAEEKELRLVMKKVGNEFLKSYTEQVAIKNEREQNVCPDFLPKIKGEYYQKTGMVKKQ